MASIFAEGYTLGSHLHHTLLTCGIWAGKCVCNVCKTLFHMGPKKSNDWVIKPAGCLEYHIPPGVSKCWK